MQRTWLRIIAGCCVLVTMLLIGIGALVHNDAFAGWALFFLIAACVAGFFAGRCPHCGCFNRYGFWDDYCGKCGGSLDD